MLADFTVDKGSHIRIEGIHQLFRPLDDSDFHTQFPQILSHFQADKAAAHHNSRFRSLLIHKFLNPEGILHRTKREQLVAIHSRKVGPDRLCTGREKQLVIAFLKNFTSFQILYGDRLTIRVNGSDLMVYLHMDAEPGEEAFRSL